MLLKNHIRWALLRREGPQLPPSPATNQNVSTYRTPTTGLESATWGSLNRPHSALVETIYRPPGVGTFYLLTFLSVAGEAGGLKRPYLVSLGPISQVSKNGVGLTKHS